MPSVASTRQAYIKAINACESSESSKWLAAFVASQWPEQTHSLLKEAFHISSDLQHGFNVLVQCAEGTDRTAQLVALASILLDPYYRTFEGFATLVDKEFGNFGFQFALRLGWKKDREKEDEKSPVFTQFLDCVFQLLKMYPLSFEYTSKYLSRVSD